MKKALLVSVFSVAVLLQGCASGGSNPLANFGKYETGTHIDSDAMGSFVDHQTTEADVMKEIGLPASRQDVRNRDVWSYGYTKISSFGGNISETTVFEFDKKGVLQAHYKAKGNASSTNPLLKAAGM